MYFSDISSSLINTVPYGNHGCSCGDVNNAFMYVIDNQGLDTNKVYPYVARVNA